MVYISGCIGMSKDTKALVSDNVEEQTRQVMENLKCIVEDCGSNMAKVVKCTVLVASMADFAKVNAIYSEYFPENPPARACFAVLELPAKALVEIDAICIE